MKTLGGALRGREAGVLVTLVIASLLTVLGTSVGTADIGALQTAGTGKWQQAMARPEPTVTATPPVPEKLDLVADSSVNLNKVPLRGFDLNNIPLNPRWGYQTPYQLADPRWLCRPLSLQPLSDPLVLNPSCTTQSPSWDGVGALPGFYSYICNHHARPFPGHSNWSPATYMGTLSNFDPSGPLKDDDYSIDLSTPEGRGAFTGDRGSVHIEFDSDETIDHFHSAWWSAFHDAVDNSSSLIGGYSPGAADLMIGGHQAIVTGSMGIDWVDTPGAELHPVWALAIQNDAGWAFFVRNWGNEGGCSSHQQVTYFPAYAFTLPWEYGFGARGQRIAATDVSILPPDIRSYRVGVPQVIIAKVPRMAVIVTFQMPGPPVGGERDGPFYEGQINLQWQFPRGTNPPPPPRPTPDPRCNKVPPPPSCGENSPENSGGSLLRQLLSVSQQAAMATALGKLDPAFSDSPVSKDAIHIVELPHLPSPAAFRPTTHEFFDAQHAQQQKLQLDLFCADLRGTVSASAICAKWRRTPPAKPRPSVGGLAMSGADWWALIHSGRVLCCWRSSIA